MRDNTGGRNKPARHQGRGFRPIRQILGALAAAALTHANLPAYGALLSQWRFDPRENQLELKVNEGTQPRYFLLAKPLRIVVDLPGTQVGTVEQVQTYSGSVRQIRVSQFQPDTARIVMELSPEVVLAPGQVQLQASGSDQTSWVLKPLIAGEAGQSVPVAIAPAPAEAARPDNPPSALETPASAAPAAPAAPETPEPLAETLPDSEDSADLLAAAAEPGIDIPIEAPAPKPSAPAAPSTPPTAQPGAIAPRRPETSAPTPAARPSGLEGPVELPPAAPFRRSSQTGVQVRVPNLGAPPPARTAATPAPSTPRVTPKPAGTTPKPAPAPEAPAAAIPAAPAAPPRPAAAPLAATAAIAPPPTAEAPVDIAVELPPAAPSDVSEPKRPAVQVPDLGRSPAVPASPQAPPAAVPAQKTEVAIEVPVELPVEEVSALPVTAETPAPAAATVQVPALVSAPAPARSPAPLEVPVELPPAQASDPELPQIQVPDLAAMPPEAPLAVPVQANPAAQGAIAPREFSFGQPLPEVIVAGSGAPSTPAPDLPAVNEAPSPSAPETVAIALPPQNPDILLSKGTQFRLRYAGDAPLTLDGDQERQEVLLLQEAVLDAAGNVVLAEGTQVVGRFETSRRGSRFFVQAVTLSDRNILVTGKSDYVSKKDSDDLLLGSGLGAIAGTVIGGFTGVGLIGGAVAGAATTFFGSAPTIVIQPGQILEVELAEDLYRR